MAAKRNLWNTSSVLNGLTYLSERCFWNSFFNVVIALKHRVFSLGLYKHHNTRFLTDLEAIILWAKRDLSYTYAFYCSSLLQFIVDHIHVINPLATGVLHCWGDQVEDWLEFWSYCGRKQIGRLFGYKSGFYCKGFVSMN